MTLPDNLKLAKLGDPKAIASAINYLLQDKKITAQADIKDDCLRVLLEAEQAPEQNSSTNLIRKLMMELGIESIKIVKIYGRQKGQSSAAWKDSLDIINISETPKINSIEKTKKEAVKAVDRKEIRKEKPNLWPAWFPYPTSWIKAIILFGFLSVIVVVIRFTGTVGYVLARMAASPEPLIFFIILALLSPILAIAIAHHILHLFVGRFVPSIQSPEIARHQGLLPGLISWWEGLYGWLVIFLATLILAAGIMGIAAIYLPFSNFSYENIRYDYSSGNEKQVLAGLSAIWIVCAAGLYQIEYLFKRRLMDAYSTNNQTAQIQPSVHPPIDVELNQMRGKMGLNQMKRNK